MVYSDEFLTTCAVRKKGCKNIPINEDQLGSLKDVLTTQVLTAISKVSNSKKAHCAMRKKGYKNIPINENQLGTLKDVLTT